jgi:hypothetical protein
MTVPGARTILLAAIATMTMTTKLIAQMKLTMLKAILQKGQMEQTRVPAMIRLQKTKTVPTARITTRNRFTVRSSKLKE